MTKAAPRLTKALVQTLLDAGTLASLAHHFEGNEELKVTLLATKLSVTRDGPKIEAQLASLILRDEFKWDVHQRESFIAKHFLGEGTVAHRIARGTYGRATASAKTIYKHDPASTAAMRAKISASIKSDSAQTGVDSRDS